MDDTSVQAAPVPRATPHEVGIAPAGIAGFVDAVNQAVGGLHSFMLLRHGKVAAEAWWHPYAPQHPHVLYSLSKSFASSAIGLAVAEGLLQVSDPVVSFFGDKSPADISENLAAMQVWHLLTMNTGHDVDATGRMQADADGDWVRGFLALPVEHAPGSKFVYNSAATFMLSAIVQKLTGETLLDYLTPRLLTPLGIVGATWESNPHGINVGGWGMSVKTEDIARFGQLYLQKGRWNGAQVLSEDWVAQASSAQVSNGDPATASDWSQGYGYQFWRCRNNAFRGDGAFGQYCVVMPDQDAVLAITSGLGNMQIVLDAAWEHLFPAMQGEADANDQDLTQMLQAQAAPYPEGKATSPLAAQVSGKTFLFSDNPQQTESVTLTTNDGKTTLSLRDGEGEHVVACGSDDWMMGTYPLDVARSNKVAARGTWNSQDTFTATLCFYETPYILTISCHFADDQVTLKRHLNVGFGPTAQPSLVGHLAQ